MNSDMHAGWANSKALERAGFAADTPDPWDGYLVRDPDGTPTGTLQEGAAYHVLRRVVPDRTQPGGWRVCARAQHELHPLGITGWQDAWVEPGLLTAYRALDDAGGLTMRGSTALWWDRHGGRNRSDRFVEQRAWGTGGNVHATTVKIMLDGCPESCTGSMLAPYEGAFGEASRHRHPVRRHRGAARRGVRLDALGFQVHQHALGDRAIRDALDAVERARAANGMNDLRHHIAHLQLPGPADIPRLRRARRGGEPPAVLVPARPAIETLTQPRVGERAARLYPIESIRASGAAIAFGSDWPVSTPNVLKEMEVAVTRQAPASRRRACSTRRADRPADGARRVHARQAYLNHDDEAGVLAAGRRADLAVIDRDLFDRSLGAIGDASVEMTVAAGRVVSGAEGRARGILCGREAVGRCALAE